jgi:hypothetical protein
MRPASLILRVRQAILPLSPFHATSIYSWNQPNLMHNHAQKLRPEMKIMRPVSLSHAYRLIVIVMFLTMQRLNKICSGWHQPFPPKLAYGFLVVHQERSSNKHK